MGQYFGTDGVRGIANLELTNELAYQLGRFGAYVLTRHLEGNKATLVIGKDTRISSDMLEASLIAGMLSVGCDVVKAGVLPTPAIAFLVNTQGFDAGVMISASHNPFEDNGIKFFDKNGFKLSDDIELEIESYICGERKIEESYTADKLGRLKEDDHLQALYLENAIRSVGTRLDGLYILLDAANGATSFLAEQAFVELGAKVDIIHHHPDGININSGCGSTHLKDLQTRVEQGVYDLGLAFDGDGDRVLAVDEDGREIDGDKIMAIIAHHMRDQGTLNNDTVVATVMSNLGFMNFMKATGIHVEMASVGDRYVLENMLNGAHRLGGEQSGHIIMLDHNQTGDGILTGLKLCEAMLASGKSLKQWGDLIPRYPQVMINARISRARKNEYLSVPAINEKIRMVEEALHGEGRVLIRPSGTEPVVRVMLEGKDTDQLSAYAREIADMYEKSLA